MPPSEAWTVVTLPERVMLGRVINPEVLTAERLSPLSVAVHRSAHTDEALTALCDAYDESIA